MSRPEEDNGDGVANNTNASRDNADVNNGNTDGDDDDDGKEVPTEHDDHEASVLSQ